MIITMQLINKKKYLFEIHLKWRYSGVGVSWMDVNLSETGRGYPSRVHVKCGGGLPKATHRKETEEPGCRICRLNVCFSCGGKADHRQCKTMGNNQFIFSAAVIHSRWMSLPVILSWTEACAASSSLRTKHWYMPWSSLLTASMSNWMLSALITWRPLPR